MSLKRIAISAKKLSLTVIKKRGGTRACPVFLLALPGILGFFQLNQVAVFPVSFPGCHTADRPTGLTVEKAQPEQVIADELECRAYGHPQPGTAFTPCQHGPCGYHSVFPGPGVVFLLGVVTVVQQIAGQET